MPILKGALYYRAALLALCGSFAVRMRVLVIEFADGFRYVPINIAVRHLKVTFRRRAHSVPFLHLELKLKSAQAGRGKHSKAQVLHFSWFQLSQDEGALGVGFSARFSDILQLWQLGATSCHFPSRPRCLERRI